MAEDTKPCAVTFWTFAIPVVIGNLAAVGVGAVTRSIYHEEALTTRKTAMAVTGLASFWFAAGLTWIYLNRRNGAST